MHYLALMASAAKRLAAELSRPGPHRVLTGDMGLVGLPGKLYTPSSGFNLPAVAFGRGWLQPAGRYTGLLKHLASWGIVAAAPDTQRHTLPSHRIYAADLATTLDVLTGVRLGDGKISVDPGKLALAGHSTGGGCAILAAASSERPVKAVVTLAAAETLPSALDAARECRMPALHLAGENDLLSPVTGFAEPLTEAWAGPVQLRVLSDATHLAFAEGRHWSELLLDGRGERKTNKTTRSLVTAFLLARLTGERGYDDLINDDLKTAPITAQRTPRLARPARR
jgi:dienelactone hydrolase